MTKFHSEALYQMCVRHFNEPMLGFDGLVRCIGYGETAVDCYIITRKRGKEYGQTGKIVWNTCVGGYTFLSRLRGQRYVLSSNGEEWDDLYRLDNQLALNGCPKENEFMLVINHDDEERLSSEQQFANEKRWLEDKIADREVELNHLHKRLNELSVAEFNEPLTTEAEIEYILDSLKEEP